MSDEPNIIDDPVGYALDQERLRRMNAEKGVEALQQKGLGVLAKHEITVRAGGVEVERPDVGQILDAFDAFATQATSRIKADAQALRDAKASAHGYMRLLDEAITERDRLEKANRALSTQMEVALGMLAEAVGEPGLAKENRIGPLIGRLVEQRDGARRERQGT